VEKKSNQKSRLKSGVFNRIQRKSGPAILAGFCLSLLGIAPVVFASDLIWTSGPLPACDGLFQPTNGWIGADGDYTVLLPNGVTLWLYSDSFIGKVSDHHRQPEKMINNSAAWQHGVQPTNAEVEFFYRRSNAGKPESLITPADGHGWFWIYDAVIVQGKLFLFLPQIERVSGDSAFGFRLTAVWLAEISNPVAPPTRWQIAQTRIPFAQFGTGGNRCFGSAVLATNGFVYIFGTWEKGHGKKMILARAPETTLADFSSWQFRARNAWSTNVIEAAELCGRMASEYSVSWLAALRKYVLICTQDGLSDKIQLRTASAPWGPWSDAKVVYQCPDVKFGKNVFCYAAKAHPMLATQPDELVITYAANSYELSDLMNDPRLYWPRFVRLQVQPVK
jgi:hypothetical protein